jgi:SAM-dependent methyltransferase
VKIPPKPGHIDNLEFIRILTPYILARRIVRHKTVLDIGCGLGHGTWLLVSEGAQQVVSIDLDKKKTTQVNEFCCHLRNYVALVMDAQRLGFRDQSFEMITCFEVLEHIPNTDLFLTEVRRILKKDGILLLTTPNRTSRLLPFQRPWNPEHLREHTLRAFRRIIKKYFPSFELLGISGEPLCNAHYIRMWKQNPFQAYFGFINRLLRRLAPTPMKKWLVDQRDHSDSKTSFDAYRDFLDRVDPMNDAEGWPFYVSQVNKKCLNFFALCGFDGGVVRKSANEIKRAQ